MKMRMLLLVPAVVLLVSLAAASPTHHRMDDNLKRTFDLAHKYNESLTEEFFVEDVSHLAVGRNKCEDKFFCKVYDILHKHEHFGKKNEEEQLVRNMKIFIDGRNPSCTELLKDLTPTRVKKPIPDLMRYLIQCIQSRNFNS
ncbi:uncharacterized protein LOC143333293 [Chaetodon auriga]|uniref:uncharacterized protein LOC143333293 n=1 Tax=Chaetodon auriga TaxID=39042 RepID=UPI004032F8F4